MTSWLWPSICCGRKNVDLNDAVEVEDTNGVKRHNCVVNATVDDECVIEQQPLRHRSESTSQVDRDTIKRLKKKAQIDDNVSSNILCCGKRPLREDQVDLCPRVWWNICWTYESQLEPDRDDSGQMRPAKDICWHCLFLCCCLPCGYPCYLTRTLRHRRRRVFRRLDVVPTATLVSGVEKPLDDNLNRSIYRTVSNTKSRFRSIDNNNKENGSDSQQQQQNVIQVNVIILQSATSISLEKHLYGGEDQNDIPQVTKSSPIIFRHRKVSTQPNLNVVKESGEEDAAAGGKRRLKHSVSIQTPARRRSSVLRRWSQLGTLGSSVARMSRRLKKTKEEEEEEENEDDRFHDVSNNEDGCEENVQLRKDGKNDRPVSQNRKESKSSIYYSFDSDNMIPSGDNVDDAREVDPEVQMKSVDQRIEIVKDLGYHLAFNVFDEASVSEWKGRDLRLANSIPDIDLLIIAVQKGNTAELEAIMNLKVGIMSYLSRFWRGFYPLLLIEVQSKDCSIEDTTEYSQKLEKVCKFFGDVHHIKIFEDTLDEQLDWIDECLARLFIHSRIFQCSRFFGNVLIRFEKCPGGCGLRKRKNRTKLSRQRAKMNRFKSLYRKPRGPI